MSDDGANAGRILACVTIEQGSNVDGIKRIHYLGNECLFGSLYEVKRKLGFFPDVLGGVDLGGGAGGRWGEYARIKWGCPRDCPRKSGITNVSEN